MGTTWVLHTETKGTGAHMVPLERVKKRSAAVEPVFVPRKATPREQPAPQRRPRRRFRVVDVITRQTLVDGGNAADALAALENVRSIVDVNVYVWQQERERWRLLTLSEQRAMFDLARRRARRPSQPPAAPPVAP